MYIRDLSRVSSISGNSDLTGATAISFFFAMQPPCSRVRGWLMLEASPYSCTEVKNFDLDKIGIKKNAILHLTENHVQL
jgi:hypothetical protein